MTGLVWRDFEDEVFNAVRQGVLDNGFCVPSRASVFRKKSYFSASRNAKIEFEIAIEAYDEGATQPSLIWIWECKHHANQNKRVEVKDVAYLQQQLNELGPSRFKGSIVTTSGFQSGAENLAKTAGISLFTFEKRLVRVTQFDCSGNEFDKEVVGAIYSIDFGGKTKNSIFESLEDVVFKGLMAHGIGPY